MAKMGLRRRDWKRKSLREFTIRSNMSMNVLLTMTVMNTMATFSLIMWKCIMGDIPKDNLQPMRAIPTTPSLIPTQRMEVEEVA